MTKKRKQIGKKGQKMRSCTGICWGWKAVLLVFRKGGGGSCIVIQAGTFKINYQKGNLSMKTKIIEFKKNVEKFTQEHLQEVETLRQGFYN